MGIPFQCNKATRKLVKALKECPCGHQSFVVRLVLVALLRGCSRRTATAASEGLGQQDRGFLAGSQLSTFLLSNRPGFITKSCSFLTCIIAMDGEKWVGGSWVKWWCLSTCK